MNDKEKLIEVLSKYFDIADPYAYNLTREKTAFAVGTMSLEDFVEFDEETMADIADHLIANNVVIQKQGEWIPIEDFDGEYHWQCTACKCEWWFEAGGPSENGSHYCPNCGAKLKEVK